MATYLVLCQFTEQGIKSVKEVPKRVEAYKQMASSYGATVKEIFWTHGQYDSVSIVEAPDEMTMTALVLSIGMLGFVRIQTLRAFSEADMKTILSKLA